MKTSSVKISANTHKLRAKIHLPASKSISNRLLMIRSLCHETFDIQNLSESDDTKILSACLQDIHSRNEFFLGDAGTPYRFLTALCSIFPGTRILNCSDGLKKRPIGELVTALQKLGASIEYLENENYPPLSVKGTNIKGGTTEIEANISSQFVSALLLIAPAFDNGLSIVLKNKIASEPYISMTLNLMKQYDISHIRNGNTITVHNQTYKAKNYIVEPDWSAAAFWYEAAALAEEAEIELPGLSKNSLQGDSIVAEIFETLGIDTTFTDDGIIIKKSLSKSDFIEFDFFNHPDLFPVLTCTCTFSNIPFRFTGIQNLVIKESNRINSIITELNKLGYEFKLENSSTLIFEGTQKKGSAFPAILSSHNDHRITMALSLAALKFPEVIIENYQCVSKSYPNFYQHLNDIGFLTDYE